MSKVIAYTDVSGETHICVPTDDMFNPESRNRKLLEAEGIVFKSNKEVLDWIIAKDVPAGANYKILNKSELPSDREFRDAWKTSQAGIDIDLPKAREIKLNKLRIPRNARLKELDLEFMKAIESGDEAKIAKVKDLKQRLRDMTKTLALDAATTVDALKAINPTVLSEEL